MVYLNNHYSDDTCCRIDFSCSVEDLQKIVEDMRCMIFFESTRQENIEHFIKLFEYVIEKKVDKKS